MTDFFIRVKQQQEQQLPFVIYSKPNEKQLIGIFQKNDHLYFAEDFTKSGFIMAPFDGQRIILIPENQSEILTVAVVTSNGSKHPRISASTDAAAKSDFEKLVQSGIDAIAKGFFSKVVLSRKETVPVPDFDAVTVFEHMVNAYPSAMTYCWYHPKIGMWTGATPEQLLRADNRKFYSVALAGTQKYDGTTDVRWQTKEKEEQQFVTDYILDNLRSIASEVVISSPYTVQAGNLLHIKTDIEGILNDNSTLREVVSVLHPTPAVCGLPKITAKDFIVRNERYDREYYSGFFGELNQNFSGEGTETDLFVNLRCMQIKNGEAYVYAGCGITKDSVPEKEYTETVHKTMTMKKMIL